MQNKARTLAAAFFFSSGAAALIYEVVWARVLGLVFGNTTFAISTVLSAYMAGLGIGGYFLGRKADGWRSPMRAYGFLEIGIGLYAAATPLLLALIQFCYIHFARTFQPGFTGLTAARLLLSFLIVFVPTFFMGGTLPVLTRFFMAKDKTAGTHIAFLYGLNTIGAVAGTVLAGFFLLPGIGVHMTLAVAVILNLGIGALACVLSTETEESRAPKREVAEVAAKTNTQRWLLGAMAVSGASAMMYEISWTRVLATVMGSSTYAFTTMLATYLLGLGLGGIVWKWVLKARPASVADFGKLQYGIVFFSLLLLPVFPWVSLAVVRLYALTLGHPHILQFSLFLVCAALMFLPAFFFGGLFPVAASLYSTGSKAIGKEVGTLYMANTVGNIIGSLATGFLLIPLIGIHKTICLASILGALLTGSALGRKIGLLAGGFLLGWSILSGIQGWDKQLLTSGIHIRPGPHVTHKNIDILSQVHNIDVLYYKEGLTCTVSVGQYGDDRHLKVNGKPDASTGEDMPTQLFAGHLPMLLHPDPKEVLVIGFGSGATLAATLAHPVKHVDCIEIEPAVMEAAPYFDEVNRKAYVDPRVRLIINDGRNQMLVDTTKYDVITSEPSNPWIAGIASLFSVEFYELTKSRLKPGGIFCQWLQAYGIAPEDFQMVVASLRKVFPHVMLWHSKSGDYLLIASEGPVAYDLANVRKRLELPLVREDFKKLSLYGEAGVLAHFGLGEKDLAEFSKAALLNTDDKLLLEFHTPLTLYESTTGVIRGIIESFQTERLPALKGIAKPPAQDAALLAQIGRGYLAMEKQKQASLFFRKALEVDDKNVDALTGMGRVLAAEKRILTAIECFQKAGNSPEALASLGWTLHLTGNSPAAAEALEKAAASPDAQWEHFIWKARVHEALEQWGKAAETYAKSMTMRSDNLLAKIAYADSLRKSGRIEEGREELEKLYRAYPTFYPLCASLRDAYLSLKDLPGAINVYKAYLHRNPYTADAWLNLAKLQAMAGDSNASMDSSEKAYRLDRFATL